MNDRLERYRTRRDPDRSPEPPGDDTSEQGDGGRRYAFQQHDASSEHWDLRLEHRGVLLSWAVPKGPSTDPRERRLAIRTEDHPIDYLDFEGVIPQDEYGGGTVVVWDAGTWSPTVGGDDEDDSPDDRDVDDRVDAAIDDGHLSFEVHGEKLGGGYLLQRHRPEDDEWLLIKRRDDGADARRNPTSTEPESVLSGRTVDEIDDGRVDGER